MDAALSANASIRALERNETSFGSSPAVRWMTANRRSSGDCCTNPSLSSRISLRPRPRILALHGTTGEDIDFALLVDGLEAEREQGITIDVAYRFFATPRRSFIVADTPGHEQYTRNMATGASNAAGCDPD